MEWCASRRAVLAHQRPPPVQQELIQQGDIDALSSALDSATTNVERVACILRKFPRGGNGTTLLHIAAGHVNATVPLEKSTEVLCFLLGIAGT